MREILFRAKCITETCLKGKWLEGYILHDGVTGKHYIHMDNCLNESDNVGEEGLLRFVAHEVDPETVCQYTGLTDKNGRKIFEGDICEIHSSSMYIDEEDGYFSVEWNEEEAGFDLCGESLAFDFDCIWGHECEVVGNIFDNPDLLQGEDT